MDAKKMKEMSEQVEQEKIEKFYANLSPTLFAAIEEQAKKGFYYLTIALHDDLNKDNWLSSYKIATKVETELKSLGYKVSSSDDVRDGTWLKIDWQ